MVASSATTALMTHREQSTGYVCFYIAVELKKQREILRKPFPEYWRYQRENINV